MPRLRVVLMMVPRLLADMIRCVLTSADIASVAGEYTSVDTRAEFLSSLDTDAIILGPAATETDATTIRMALPRVRVLSLPPDLRSLCGPGEHERRPFTVRNLIAVLQP